MMAVIFEVTPAPGQRGAYLDAAAALKPLLAQIDGFVSIERFESLSAPGKLLSLSLWRDEEAVARWRQQEAHRSTQAAGRAHVFAHSRLRDETEVHDNGMHDRTHAPAHTRRPHT